MVQIFLQKILLYESGEGMKYLNRIMLGTILVLVIPIPLLEIIWIIKNKETTELE